MPRTPFDNLTFAKEWVAAWNAKDLPLILSHYTETCEMVSPYYAKIMSVPHGTVKGKQALREYWTYGLSLSPQLEFELLQVCHGVDMCSIYYKAKHTGKLVVESFWFDGEGLVVRACSAYSE